MARLQSTVVVTNIRAKGKRKERQFGLAVTCVPKVPIWKMFDFSGLHDACARICLISR
jgi:hypothetical protein